MNLSLRKATVIPKTENLALVASDIGSIDRRILKKNELEFVRREAKKKSKLITINQYSRLVVICLVDSNGKGDHMLLEAYRRAGDSLVSLLNRSKATSVCVVSKEGENELSAFAEGMLLGNYQFLKYKSKPENNTLKKFSFFAPQLKQQDLDATKTVCEAVYHARNLVNEPVISLNATDLANAFKGMGKDAGFSVKVFEKAKIKELKMGGLLAVNMGSIDPPTFTVMEWKPNKHVNEKPIILVGKGVVYDTGGLSLKPTPGSMDYMKCDMAGGAAVGSAMYAIAKLKLPLHVMALVPATDNRPDGNAYTPGDVITMMSGLKVEVLNTDAEGRMILADALHYAKQFQPELVMEFSTLTGAAAAAIGQYGIVAMGTCEDDTRRDLHKSGEMVYERLAEFPFWDEYDELIRSDVADIKNIGGPSAGAITAGRFLKKFTDYPYMHFDIAGPAFGKGGDSYRGKNGTGVGVRLIVEYLKRRANK
ncbi:MAG: leucyl aminopeptidase family protein [Bacteroidota bacterium]|jgi:leucyl aminopeptidase